MYLKRLFASLPLAEFGIPQLKTVRQAMVDDGRVRNQVNRRVGMVRMFFRWCVEEGLVSGAVLETLRALRPLAPGRSGAVEGEPVGPADAGNVDKVLPLLPPAVRAVVGLLRLTGARPGEVLNMRPRELDRSGPVWTLTPTRHKGSWRGKARVVFLGPDAQAMLAPWRIRAEGPDAFVFSPAASEAIRNAERAEARVTPKFPSHMRRNAAKRKGERRTRPPAAGRRPPGSVPGRCRRPSAGRAANSKCRRSRHTSCGT